MGKTLVIGGAGLLGSAVVKALGEETCIVASRNSGEQVDISDPASIAALFERVGELDGIVCAGGTIRFKPWDEADDEDWAFCVANKQMGQINVARLGAAHVRPGGAIVLTTGLLTQHPTPGGLMASTANGAVEAFALATTVEDLPVRINVVSPGWVTETLEAMGLDTSEGIPAAEVALAYIRQLKDGAAGSVLPSMKA